MDPLTIAAAGGLRSRMESLSLLANNLANAGTAGYKSDRESYALYASTEAEDPGGNVSTLPSIERQWTDFSQGTLQITGNALDLAVSGKGFLVVKGPAGPLYTRNGNLQVSPKGELVTAEGWPIQTPDGKSLKVSSENPIEVAPDGTVRQDGALLGQVAVVNFKSTDSLQKMSGTNFQNVDPKNKPLVAADAQVLQGKLEGSNVAVPEAAMRLVGVMRQFEMLQKAVSIGVEMNTKAIQEVARVGA